MATRAGIVLATLALVSGIAIAAPETGTMTLCSQRRNVTVLVKAPAGFTGGTYQAWPSYDLFSFAHGNEPTACYLQVRFDAYSDEPGDRHSAEDIVVHWNSTPLPKIREQYRREFQNPQVDLIETMTLAGKPARVHAVYNADGNFYAAEIFHEGTVISFELRSPSRRELQRHKAGFLSFLRSVKIRAI
jgi:hypothetical protein